VVSIPADLWFLAVVNERQILCCIGKNIKTARLRAGLTQECLAELIGIHWKTLGNIECGVYPFAVTHLVGITQHLGVTSDSLFQGIEPTDTKRADAIRKAMTRKRRPKGNDSPIAQEKSE